MTGQTCREACFYLGLGRGKFRSKNEIEVCLAKYARSVGTRLMTIVTILRLQLSFRSFYLKPHTVLITRFKAINPSTIDSIKLRSSFYIGAKQVD